MIESLSIRGFQNHVKMDIEFGKITVLLAPSDHGKSAVLRALRWLLTNQPDGTRHINWDKDICKVSAMIDGKKVIRKRGRKGPNVYLLDGKKFKAVGRKVPAEIESLVNVGPVSFSSQHELPYWFSDTPGQVSKHLNAIINLDVMDRSLAHAAAVARKARIAVEISKDRMRDAMADKRSLDWAVEADADLKRIEKKQSASEATEKRLCLVRTLRAQMDKMERGLRSVPDMFGLVKDFDVFLAKKNSQCELRTMMVLWERKEREAADAKERSDRAGARLAKMMEGKCPLCGK